MSLHLQQPSKYETMHIGEGIEPFEYLNRLNMNAKVMPQSVEKLSGLRTSNLARMANG